MKAGQTGKDKDASVTIGEPMANHTSLRIGGRAEIFARPVNADALSRLLECASGIPVFFVGGGTNLLITDEDIKALVISTVDMRGIELRETQGNGAVLSVSAGEPLRKILAFCMNNGLSGLEPLAGIPGTIGGAVAGNAGAHGLQIGDLVSRALIADSAGKVKTVVKEDMGFKYRRSSVSGLILQVDLALEKGKKPEEIKELMQRNFEMKKKTQPLAARSAGCVFKNPEGQKNSAGRLIDAAGLKGRRVGDIEVSGMHANFFINTGKGSAADFLELMDKVRDEVKKRSGVVLEPEIRVISNVNN